MYGPNINVILHKRILISINIKSRLFYATVLSRCGPVVYYALKRVHSLIDLIAKGGNVGR